MKIAILEIAPTGHYTYVESIVNIYLSKINNHIEIFTNKKGKKNLQHLENERVKVIAKQDTEGYESFLQSIKNFDKLFVVTLEAYAKEPFKIMQAFERIDFQCPIYYVIHNVDFWFEQSFNNRLKNIFSDYQGLKQFWYKLKIYFYYVNIQKKIIEKVKKSGGKFATLTQSVSDELSRFVNRNHLIVIPFSVFKDNMKDQTNPKEGIRICIAGYVSAVRRDYFSIFDALQNPKYQSLKNVLVWDLLGGINEAEGGKAIVEKANEMQKNGHKIIIHNKQMVGLEEFDENLSKADLVLGNMHLQQGATGRYGKSKETGVIFTMIKAAKVGLLPTEYTCEPALKTSVLTFDNYEHLLEILLALSQKPETLLQLKQEAYKNALFYSPEKVYQRIEN